MPILDPPAPSFESIAQRTDIGAEWLEEFITTTHRGLDSPKGMPNPSLVDYQVKEVVAYLLSLRK
jgi:cytochrome c1